MPNSGGPVEGVGPRPQTRRRRHFRVPTGLGGVCSGASAVPSAPDAGEAGLSPERHARPPRYRRATITTRRQSWRAMRAARTTPVLAHDDGTSPTRPRTQFATTSKRYILAARRPTPLSRPARKSILPGASRQWSSHRKYRTPDVPRELTVCDAIDRLGCIAPPFLIPKVFAALVHYCVLRLRQRIPIPRSPVPTSASEAGSGVVLVPSWMSQLTSIEPELL